MNCFFRAVGVVGILLFAAPEASAHAVGWRLSQSTPPQKIQDLSVPVVAAQEQAQPAPQSPPSSMQKEQSPSVQKGATPQGDEDGTPATVVDDRDAEGILGKSVYSAANEDMGRVVDVIAKRTGEVRAAVIDFGGFLGVGSRTIAVDWSALRFPTSGPMDHIILRLTRNQVRLAPEYKPGEPLVVLGLGDVQPHPETPAPEH